MVIFAAGFGSQCLSPRLIFAASYGEHQYYESLPSVSPIPFSLALRILVLQTARSIQLTGLFLIMLAIDSSISFVFLGCTGQEQIYYTVLVIFRVVSGKGWDAEARSTVADKVSGRLSRSRTNEEEAMR